MIRLIVRNCICIVPLDMVLAVFINKNLLAGNQCVYSVTMCVLSQIPSG